MPLEGRLEKKKAISNKGERGSHQKITLFSHSPKSPVSGQQSVHFAILKVVQQSGQ